MELKVTAYDSEGKELHPKCKCGKEASCCFAGEESFMWLCHECAFGKQETDLIVEYDPRFKTSQILDDSKLIDLSWTTPKK